MESGLFRLTLFKLGILLLHVLCIYTLEELTAPQELLPTGISCASYVISNGTQGNVTGTCTYPELFSRINRSCLPFYDVDCDNRPEPITPCDYPDNNCTTEYATENANWTGLCVCPNTKYNLNYNACEKRKNGLYPWPARKWTPFYIECRENRTLPSTCSGASAIFDLFGKKCNNINSVVSEAYQLSALQRLPSSLYLLGGKDTATPAYPLSMSTSTGLNKITQTSFQLLYKSQMSEIDSMSPDAYGFSFTLTGHESLHSSQMFKIDSLSTKTHFYSITAKVHSSLQKFQMPTTDSLSTRTEVFSTPSDALRSSQKAQMTDLDSLSPSTDFYSITANAHASVQKFQLSTTDSLSTSTEVFSLSSTAHRSPQKSQMPALYSLSPSTDIYSITSTTLRSLHGSHVSKTGSLSLITELSSIKSTALRSLQKSKTFDLSMNTVSHSVSLPGKLRQSVTSSFKNVHFEKTTDFITGSSSALHISSELLSLQIDSTDVNSLEVLNTIQTPDSSNIELTQSSDSHGNSTMYPMRSSASFVASQAGFGKTSIGISSILFNLSEPIFHQSTGTIHLYPASTNPLTATYFQEHSFSSPLSPVDSSNIYSDQSFSTFQMLQSSEFELTQSTDISRGSTAFSISSYAALTTSQTQARYTLIEKNTFGQYSSDTVDHKLTESMSLMPKVSTTNSTAVTTTPLGSIVVSDNLKETQLTDYQNLVTSAKHFETTQTTTTVMYSQQVPLSTFSNSQSVTSDQSTKAASVAEISNNSNNIMSTLLPSSAIHLHISQPTTESTIQAGFRNTTDTIETGVADTLKTKTSPNEIGHLDVSTPRVLLSDPMSFSTPTLVVTPNSINYKTSVHFQALPTTYQTFDQSSLGKDGNKVNISMGSTIMSSIAETSIQYGLSETQQQKISEIKPSSLSVVSSSPVLTLRLVSKTDISSVVPTANTNISFHGDSAKTSTKPSSKLSSTKTPVQLHPSTTLINYLNSMPSDVITSVDIKDTGFEITLPLSYSSNGLSSEPLEHSHIRQTAAPLKIISSAPVASPTLQKSHLATKVPPVSVNELHTSSTASNITRYTPTIELSSKPEYTPSFQPSTLRSMSTKTASAESLASTPVSTSSASIVSTSLTEFNAFSLTTKHVTTFSQEHISSQVVLHPSELIISSFNASFISSKVSSLSSTPTFNTAAMSMSAISNQSVTLSSPISVQVSTQSSETNLTSLSNNTSARKSTSGSDDRFVLPLAAGITSGALVIVALTVVAIISVRRHSSKTNFPKEGMTARL